MKQRSILLIFLVVITLLICKASALLIPEDGLVAYYTFDDGSATDNSGHGYDGQIYEAVTTPGISGNALYFNGADAYIRVSHSPAFDPSSFTLAGWAKFTGSGDDYQHIVSKHVNYLGVREGFVLQYVNDDAGTGGINSNKLAFFTGNGGGPGYDQIYSGIVEPGNWYYIVGTYDGTEKRLYLNGTPAGSSISNNIVYSNHDLLIGCGDTTTGQIGVFFRGTIDEVVFYNRVLSTSEISDIYDNYINQRYTINATNVGGGSISPTGDTVVLSGQDQSFNLQSNKPYQLTMITIDDITIDLKNLVVTFNNVFSNHTISAEFTSPSNKPPK